jgi:hypothetical protein
MKTARAELEEILTKMTVGKGGKGASKDLGGGYRIGFWENTDRDTHKTHPYMMSLSLTGKGESFMYLRREDVFTKTNAMWVRDSVWRLTPAAITRIVDSVLSVMDRDPRNV